MNYKLYQVGGSVRDELLGKQPTDIDYLIVVNDKIPAKRAFDDLQTKLKEDGYLIFSVKEDHWTIRTKFPKDHPAYPKLVADFQLAVTDDMTGTLHDNLYDRDFTINAMAKDVETGEIIDPLCGQQDLLCRRLNPTSLYSLKNDPIRVVRAIRFAVTFGLCYTAAMIGDIKQLRLDWFTSVDDNRLKRELKKMLEYDTRMSLILLHDLYVLNQGVFNYIFQRIKLNPIVRSIKIKYVKN
jgi:tRNA nucleotidyltransferase/poly(A) polymerase